jgi:CheY-like chemotaxis protein
MGQAQPWRPTVLIVEDDAEVRRLTVALLEDGQMDTIECESAEAALAVMLMGGRARSTPSIAPGSRTSAKIMARNRGCVLPARPAGSDVVEERSEPLLLPLPCSLPYALQRL